MFEFYQKNISPLLHSLSNYLFGSRQGCRFTPTCSEYLKLSLKKYGFIKGSIRGIIRFLKCNPLFKGGIDMP